MRISLLIIFSLFLSTHLISQSILLKGSVTDNIEGIPLNGVSVVLMDSLTTSILKFTYTDLNGNFILETDSSKWLKLMFSSLGYESRSKYFKIDKDKSELLFDIFLVQKSLALNEVIVQSKRPISFKKDTITFQTKFFTKGNEQNIEELLKTIPGLNIDSDGKIKVGDQEIEKIMIDGDDFFEKGYRLLSKNMPAYPIEEVEVLKNYSHNRLLKDIEETNKVALNLKLSEKAKRIWFGNADIGLGNDGFYELRANLMNFGKKNKYYIFTNLNTTGYYSSDDIKNLISPASEISGIGDNHRIQNLMNLTFPNLGFNTNRTNLNDSKVLSLNTIFNVTNKVKIKTLGFFNWDKSDFLKKSTDRINLGNVNFVNMETYLLQNTNNLGFGKFDLTYDISKTQVFEMSTKYNDAVNKSFSNLNFNGNSTVENLAQRGKYLDQNISYTNKFRKKKALLFTARYIRENAPQNYSINKFFLKIYLPLLTQTI